MVPLIPTTLQKTAKFPAFGLALGLVLFTLWHWVVRSPAVDYGSTGSVYFLPHRAAPGDVISMHFSDVTWYRVCPSKLYTYFRSASGRRIDLPVHEVSYPMETGRLPGKVRPFTVPQPDQFGPGAVEGHIDSACWPFEGLPVVTKLPSVPLEIVRR